ncbi:GH92 family glycosyl hydrolase [Sphingobacterium suaedae]|uniref:GH92 family glycosyl hydrolase n=1 Tax=Sphingobacterium suaedae TaxID=1686402 RepID=A0ABW5KD88_9SPHI
MMSRATYTKFFLFFGTYFIALASIFAQTRVIWKIGEPDKGIKEFALAPASYRDFLKEDFGWEDRFFLVGYSEIGRDWPYILPGPADAWGGTSNTAGLRTHFLNVLFQLDNVNHNDQFYLIIDALDRDLQSPPFLKISINGMLTKILLPKGSGGGALEGDFSKSVNHTIRIPIDLGTLKNGSNSIRLTVLEGSWLIFDDMRLESSTGQAVLRPVNSEVYLRQVEAASYEIAGRDAPVQPLLIDAERLSGSPMLQVTLDGQNILQQQLEQGRYILEAPMPSVSEETKSTYVVRADGKILQEGEIIRSPQQKRTSADYVDTRLGAAHSRWMIAPGPWMPFSMVKLSPDNQNAGWQAGYEPSFESVGTFSHVHEWTMGGLGIMPVNGLLRTDIGDQSELVHKNGYRSLIDKRTEVASLGYYRADLTDYGIQAELTATTRCGFQRYTYPTDKDARIMIDLKIPTEYDYDILSAEIRKVGKRRIEGYSKQRSKGVWSTDADQEYTLFFVIDFDRDIKKMGGWIDEQQIVKSIVSATDPSKFGAFVEFSTSKENVVQVRSAISYVDMEGARKNLLEEVARPFGWDFSAVVKANVRTWNDLFGRVAIKTNDAREKTRFYTNMYRAFCRNTFSDVDGRWVDAAERVQQFTDNDGVALGCDAFWNTFWNLNQLWNLVAPEWSSRWVKSQLAMYDAHGWLAKGPAGMEYIPVMVGEHEIPLLVSTYQMGIRDYDVEKMYQAVRKMQTTLPEKVGDGFAGNRDLAVYLKYGFVPADSGRFSNTLEYAYDDWTVSQLAKALGKESDYALFADRGNWWKHAINPETGYAHLRYSNGNWERAFDPFKTGANHHYVEGNAWQLTYFVPQDIPALANRIGVDQFITRLTWGFESSEPWRYNAPGDQYWDFPVVQGNQQSMHFSFLFNWVGQPWQTQRWSRSILDRYYGFEMDNAYLGDEDQGQMSAWFIMAAMGLFQTDGGCTVDPVYEIGSPLYPEISIDLGERYGRGKKFVVKANKASKKNKYVQSARLNGRPLRSFKFPAKELLKGGVLELEMGEQPNLLWGMER